MKYYEMTVILKAPQAMVIVRCPTWAEMDTAITEAKAKYDGRWTSIDVQLVDTRPTVREVYWETPKPEAG